MSKSDKAPSAVLRLGSDEQIRVAIVAAEWNGDITGALTASAIASLTSAGVSDGAWCEEVRHTSIMYAKA